MNIMKLTSTLEEEIPSIARKPKMHMLQHLPGDVNNFGPSSCFNTERYFYLSIIYLSMHVQQCVWVCGIFIMCLLNHVFTTMYMWDSLSMTRVNILKSMTFLSDIPKPNPQAPQTYGEPVNTHTTTC